MSYMKVILLYFASNILISSVAAYYSYFGGHAAFRTAPAIEHGIGKAHEECKRQFRGNRFDCPTKLFYQLVNPSKKYKYKG